MSLDLPQMYAEMEGEGELWVGEDGLPIRQLIYLQFPNTASDQVEARIDVTFSNYLQRPKQAYFDTTIGVVFYWRWDLAGGYRHPFHGSIR